MASTDGSNPFLLALFPGLTSIPGNFYNKRVPYRCLRIYVQHFIMLKSMALDILYAVLGSFDRANIVLCGILEIGSLPEMLASLA